MKLHLEEKVVAITGGTVGIGKACVDAFLAEGCKVAICARSAQTLAEFRIAYADKAVLAVQADVSHFAQMEAFATHTVERFGRLDVWVNNAGIYPRGDLMDMPLDTWQQTLDVNLSGVLYGCRAAVPHMRKQGKGVIINASSFATVIPSANRGAYAISKIGVDYLTRTLAAELAADHIRVVTFKPGFILTDLTAEFLAEHGDALNKLTALNRHGLPEDIAPVVVFLASDAAGFINGTGIEASGGKFCVQNPHYSWTKK